MGREGGKEEGVWDEGGGFGLRNGEGRRKGGRCVG